MATGILTKADSPSSGFGYLTVGNSGSGSIYSKKILNIKLNYISTSKHIVKYNLHIYTIE